MSFLPQIVKIINDYPEKNRVWTSITNKLEHPQPSDNAITASGWRQTNMVIVNMQK